MTISIRLEEDDQTTVIEVEDELVAVKIFCGDPRSEHLERPDPVMLLDIEGLERLRTALYLAGVELWNEARLEQFRFMPSPTCSQVVAGSQ